MEIDEGARSIFPCSVLDRTVSGNVLEVLFRHRLNVHRHAVILKPIHKVLNFHFLLLILKTIS